MFEPIATLPIEELRQRWQRCRTALAETRPEAGGLLVFTRLHIYYLTGTLGQGCLWLPMHGEPVLAIRKGLERARLESAMENVAAFKSFKELPGLAADAGVPLPPTVAAETSGLSWQLGEMLKSRLDGVAFVPGDQALALARSVKTPLELDLLREAGRRHHQCLYHDLPARIRPGMSERDVAVACWDVFFAAGHHGMMRMNAFGEEIFLGHVAAGDSGNYPSAFNGPLGLRGTHPAAPYMGNAERIWEPGQVLSCDVGFQRAGYHTDKTQCYFSGPASAVPDDIRRAQDFCIEVQARLAERCRPGATPDELHRLALDMAEARGMGEGFMGLGDNKVPFVGHGIGLAVDGWPPLATGFERPLEAGMVLALEPKQGIPGVGMPGVENTFEVTEDGGVCLTGDAYDIVCVD